jgi:hypothetical protein
MTDRLNDCDLDVPVGRYIVEFFGDSKFQYLCEKRDSGWFMIDGTGWEEAFGQGDLSAIKPYRPRSSYD